VIAKTRSLVSAVCNRQNTAINHGIPPPPPSIVSLVSATYGEITAKLDGREHHVPFALYA